MANKVGETWRAEPKTPCPVDRSVTNESESVVEYLKCHNAITKTEKYWDHVTCTEVDPFKKFLQLPVKGDVAD